MRRGDASDLQATVEPLLVQPVESIAPPVWKNCTNPVKVESRVGAGGAMPMLSSSSAVQCFFEQPVGESEKTVCVWASAVAKAQPPALAVQLAYSLIRARQKRYDIARAGVVSRNC